MGTVAGTMFPCEHFVTINSATLWLHTVKDYHRVKKPYYVAPIQL